MQEVLEEIKQRTRIVVTAARGYTLLARVVSNFLTYSL